MPPLREVERVVEELGYWPGRAQFIHEAIMEKLEKYKREMKLGGKNPQELNSLKASP